MSKLAIIVTHPIQYYAPLFRNLAKELDLMVFYTWSQSQGKVLDKDFGIERQWDIPLLEGYNFRFINNISKNPGSHHFKGIITPTLIQEIKNWQADVLLVFGWNFHSHLQVMRYFKGKLPVIFRGDSTLLDESRGFSFRKMIRRIALTWVYRHVDYALYVGKANKAYYLAHGLRENQLIFAPHAIDNDRFSELSEEQEAFIRQQKNEFGIRAGDITFLFCGKFQPKKNSMLLLEGFRQINLANAHLIFVGNGELEAQLKAEAEFVKNVHFLRFQNQSMMPAIYRLGDILCLPSSGPGETWGLAVNEAMACSRAVLVSDKCGCAADLVQNGVNGYVFRSDDIEDLKDKMQMLIKQRDRINKYGAASNKMISRWNFESIRVAITQLLSSIEKR